MTVKKNEEFVSVEKSVQFSDILKLQKDLEAFEQKRYGTVLISRILQFLSSLGTVRIYENEDISVLDTAAYAWYMKIEEQRKSFEGKQMEREGRVPHFDWSFHRDISKKMPVLS